MRKQAAGRQGGRPEIGPAFSLRFPPELLTKVDEAAAAEGVTRAAWIRTATETRITATPRPAATHDQKGLIMNDQKVSDVTKDPTKVPTPEHLSWPEDNSKPGPDGSVLIKVRHWDLPKHP